jgi:hypothetical protein
VRDALTPETPTLDRPAAELAIEPQVARVAPAAEPTPATEPAPAAQRKPVGEWRPVAPWAAAQGDPLARRGEPGWRASWRAAAVAWVASYLALLTVTVYGWLLPTMRPHLASALRAADRNDAEWFVLLARRGYAGPFVDQSGPTVYFPLFPLLIRTADRVLPGGTLVAAYAVTAFALLGGLVVLHRLVAREVDDAVARRAIWYLVAFPAGFFLAVPYNHALVLLLTAGCLYLLRRQRWWAAAAVGGLATATQVTTIVLVVAFVWEYVRLHRLRPRWSALAVLLVPTGLAAVMATQRWRFADPLRFYHVRLEQGRVPDWPWHGVRSAVHAARPLWYGIADAPLRNLVDLALLGFVALLLVLGFVGPFRLRSDQYGLLVYGLVVLLAVMCFPIYVTGEPYASAPRLVLAAFPAFVVLGVAGRHATVHRLYLLPSLATYGVLASVFLAGGWVA